MPISSTNLLQKLEELRRWQEEQQERLLQQHHRRLRNDVSTEGTLSQTQDSNVRKSENSSVLRARPHQELIQIDDDAENDNGAKPKRRYLRRGAGLVRFRMSAGDQFKPFRNKRCFKRPSIVLPKIKPQNCYRKEESDTLSATPLKKPDSTVLPQATWSAILGSKEYNDQGPSIDKAETFDVSRSEKELLNFETLEKRTTQGSFCSTNSSIIRLLSSTPAKSSPIKTGHVPDSDNTYREERSVRQVYNNERQLQSVHAHRQMTENGVRKELHYTQYDSNPQTPTGDDDRATGTAQDVRDFQAEERRLQKDYLTLIEQALEFKQLVAGGKVGGSDSSASSVTSDDVRDFPQPNRHDNETQWSSNGSSPGPARTEGGHHVCEEAVQSKLLELQRDTEIVRSKDAKLNKLRERLERQQREFNRQKKELLKQIEEERAKIGSVLEEEKKKLAKERMVFDRYVRESRNRPSKGEREEMSALKAEAAALRETLKLKEARNGTTQARLRNHIKALEKENGALKEEIDALNRRNGQLVASQRSSSGRAPSDTKLLHEINRHLTKLTRKEQPVPVDAVRTEGGRGPADEATRPAPARAEKENDRNATNAAAEQGEPIREGRDGGDKDRTERLLENGTREIRYGNGNVKTILPDGNVIVFKYHNGDTKETNLLEGTIRYVYCDSRVTHTTYADGTELIEFPDGQTEKRLNGGACEIRYSNGIVRRFSDNGTEEVQFPDGTAVTTSVQGERVLSLPNGQTEVHTKDHKRREYPDGTVKILYSDGLQETRYSNGRIRLKDKHGKLLMDSRDDT